MRQSVLAPPSFELATKDTHMFTSFSAASFLAFGIPGGMGEWLLIAAVGLLLFGKRLPEVGRSLGKGIVEFKKGLKGVEDTTWLLAGLEPSTSSSMPLMPFLNSTMPLPR